MISKLLINEKCDQKFEGHSYIVEQYLNNFCLQIFHESIGLNKLCTNNGQKLQIFHIFCAYVTF